MMIVIRIIFIIVIMATMIHNHNYDHHHYVYDSNYDCDYDDNDLNHAVHNSYHDLREVGPSRKILHVRGVGSETRKNVRRVVGSWGALRPKVFFDNWLLRTPLGVSPHARTFEDFEKN